MDGSQAEGHAPVTVEQVVALAKVAETQNLEIQELVASRELLVQRLGFIKAVLATVVFVAIWKTCVLMGLKTWGGGAFTGALMTFFPTVFDWRSYERTKKCNPLVGQALMFGIAIIFVIILDVLIEVLRISQ